MILLDEVVQILGLAQLDGHTAVGHQAVHGSSVGSALKYRTRAPVPQPLGTADVSPSFEPRQALPPSLLPLTDFQARSPDQLCSSRGGRPQTFECSRQAALEVTSSRRSKSTTMALRWA